MWPFKRASADPRGEFWSWFRENRGRHKTIRDGNQRVLRDIQGHLRKVHKDLVFELGIGEGDQWEFIVSADGLREMIPEVEALVRAAPPIPGWTVIAFRPRKDDIQLQVHDATVDPSTLWFRHRLGKGSIDLTIALPVPKNMPLSDQFQIAFLLMDAVLGEYDVMTKVGEVDLFPMPADPAAEGFQPLTELRQIVDALI